MKRMTLRDRLPKTCTLEDVCRALNISRATYYARQAENKFPIPELLPRLDRRPRFSGEKVLAYLEGRGQSQDVHV